MKHLRLTILNATHIPNKDSGAYMANLCVRNRDVSDPYVIAQVGQQQQRTSTVMNNLNPIFNETFYFNITDPVNDVLTLSVYDYDQFSKDDFIGVTAYPVSMFRLGLAVKLSLTFTVPCKCCSKKVPPNINLEATLLDAIPQVNAQVPSVYGSQMPMNHQMGGYTSTTPAPGVQYPQYNTMPPQYPAPQQSYGNMPPQYPAPQQSYPSYSPAPQQPYPPQYPQQPQQYRQY